MFILIVSLVSFEVLAYVHIIDNYINCSHVFLTSDSLVEFQVLPYIYFPDIWNC